MVMENETEETEETQEIALSGYQSILLAADSSDHANRGAEEAAKLADSYGAKITGAHVYAAEMHDRRFRQMEGGLPEQFRAEDELERQRDVHDDLITRGLSIITDSYLDQVERACDELKVTYDRKSLEGKNYWELAKEANSGAYDLLVMGSLGVGAIPGSRIGTVCERVVRRCEIDCLVIKDVKQTISDGPIVVAIDGSAKAYGGLLTAFSLSREWDVPIKVVSAFDPYFHYVAFNRIAGVLSDEASEVFRFQDQEKLHEEIIDSGLAKIYQGHLEVAETLAEEHGITIETELLTGKPWDAVGKYVRKQKPSLLVIGKLGIHADDGLDIGGNSENLLRNVTCAVLLSQKEFTPEIEVVSDVTTSWTHEAESRMDRVPSFVRNMARVAILRYAHERGHTVITASIVEAATDELMPHGAHDAMQEIVAAHDKKEAKKSLSDDMTWGDDAKALLANIADDSLRQNVQMRAEKRARSLDRRNVDASDVAQFLEADDAPEEESPDLNWTAEALARMARVPQGFMRKAAESRVIAAASDAGVTEITLDVVEDGLTRARQVMETSMSGEEAPKPEAPTPHSGWDAEASARLNRVPEGLCRNLTTKLARDFAAADGVSEITGEYFGEVLDRFQEASDGVERTLTWDEAAEGVMSTVPDMVTGLFMKEVESFAKTKELDQVTFDIVTEFRAEWDRPEKFLSPETQDADAITWSPEAELAMERVPEGFMRTLTRQRVEEMARNAGSSIVTQEIIDAKYTEWGDGGSSYSQELDWDDDAVDAMGAMPDFVRAMVIHEVEKRVSETGATRVTLSGFKTAREAWAESGMFHGHHG